METIEIGAVRLNADLEPVDEFDRFVRPVIRPVLSVFCRRLTSITQADIDGAERFPAVLADFMRWIGPRPFVWYSWGDFDRAQLVRDADRHRLPFPAGLRAHRNLKQMYAAHKNLAEPMGMRRALRQQGIPFAGRLHRGIDDARCTARLAQVVLRGVPSPTSMERV